MAQTFEDYYANTFKPTYQAWASTAARADVTEPSQAKVLQGWVIEKPRHAYFNWWQNRTDKRIEMLEAKIAWLESKLNISEG